MSTHHPSTPLPLTDETKTIGELVAEKPARSRFFEQLNIDYCCGGRQPILLACQEAHLDVQQVLSDLQKFDDETATNQSSEVTWLDASITQLIHHIVNVHHQFLKEELPRVHQLAEKVARVHGKNHTELLRIYELVQALRNDLDNHLEKEETVLFPYCQSLDEAKTLPEIHCGHVSNPVSVMVREHEDAGKILKELRELTQNFQPPEDACNTYRALFESLERIESDIHQHIHKENNILFPKVLKQVEALS